MMVFTPAQEDKNRQAQWLFWSGQRKPVAIDFHKLHLKVEHGVYRGTQPLVIQARYRGESQEAIPAQQVLLLPKEKVKPGFVLFRGGYEVDVKDAENNVLSRYSQTVR